MYFAAEVIPGKVTWIDASPDNPIHLTSASLLKRAKKPDGRVVLQICAHQDDSPEDSFGISLGVLSAKLTESIYLDVLINSHMGLLLAGADSTGAVVHVVGNELSSGSMDSDDEAEEELELSPDMVNVGVEMVFNGQPVFLSGGDDAGEEDSEDEDVSEDGGDGEEESDMEIEAVADMPKVQGGKRNRRDEKNGDDTNDKAVVKRRTGGLPIVQHRSGLKFQDIIIGTGKPVVKGHNVAMQYVLRLENGKVIDRADRRKPFKFRLGIGECVKGFDIGIAGMREGGERHLIVPPQLGYGSDPPPGIPKNSTLYFDVGVVKAY